MEEVEINNQKNELIQRFRKLLENPGLRLDQKIMQPIFRPAPYPGGRSVNKGQLILFRRRLLGWRDTTKWATYNDCPKASIGLTSYAFLRSARHK